MPKSFVACVMVCLATCCAAGTHDDAPALSADPDRLIATIRSLPDQRSPGPTPEHIAGLQRTETLLLDAVKSFGLDPTTQTVHWGRRGEPPREWRNIIFSLPGSEKPTEVLIVGAHFDAVPKSPGADDNASGVAALLEIARLLKNRPTPLKRTVRFVLFNLEEVGLVGSTQYAPLVAEKIAAGEETVLGMCSLEMLGFYTDAPGSQKNPFAALKGLAVPDTGDFLAIATTLTHRPFVRSLERHMTAAALPQAKFFVFDLLPMAPPDLLRSDHAPFLLRGIPAAMITDTANFRNPHYHQPTDTPETIDLPRLARAVSALAAGIAGVTDDGVPPAPEAPPATPK